MQQRCFEILLIEDNPGDARLIQLMLSGGAGASFKLSHADRLSAGLDHIASRRVDAVLLDLSLPDSQNLEGFRALRDHVPDLPIVVLSGLDNEELATSAVRAGAQDYLIKGRAETDTLIRSLRYGIERSLIERERSLLLAREQSARLEAEEAVLALNQHVRQQAAVTELGQAALAGRDIQTLMNAAAEEITAALMMEYAGVLEVQPDGERLTLRAGVGWEEGLVGQATIPLSPQSPAGMAVLTGDPVSIHDLTADPRFGCDDVLSRHGMISSACVLIQGRDRCWGVLGAHTATKRKFSTHDVNFLQSVANILSTAIERQQVEQESAALHSAALAIGVELDLEARLDRVLDAAQGLVNADAALIGVIDRGADEINVLAMRGGRSVASDTRIPLGQDMMEMIAATGRPARIGDLLSDPRGAGAGSAFLEGARSMLGVPLIDRGGTFGLLMVYSQAPTAFGARSEEVLASLGDLAAAALREAQLRLEAQEAEARYHSLFDGVTDAIIVADQSGRYIDANRAAIELFGYQRDELLQMRVGDLSIAPRAETLALFEAFRRTGRHAASGEVRRKDGAIVPVVGRGAILQLRNGPVYVGIVQDLTEQLALERMRQDLVAMIAHDLRTPLTSVKGYAQLMRRRQSYSERAIEMIMSQTDHLGRLLNDLLDSVRSETGRLELRREPNDLAIILRACVDQAQAGAQNYVVRLSLPETRLVGYWDRDRLEQIVRNLLTNALKHADGREVLVRAECAPGAVQVSIEDDGAGIPSDLLPDLFNPFTRGKDNKRTDGLGLGLYITKLLVEAHGGRIWAESPPGRGAVFTCTLPLGPDDAQRQIAADERQLLGVPC